MSNYINVYYFPKKWLPLLEDYLLTTSRVKKAGVYPRDDSEFVEIIFDGDATDILLMGYYMGYEDISRAIKNTAMPQVLRNIENLVTKLQTPSEN